MTPSWEHNLKNFYDDFTHKQPFNLVSIVDLHKTSNFSQVKADYFIQLPELWKSDIFFQKFCILISFFKRIFVTDTLKKYSKFVFFSKEVKSIKALQKK